MQTDILQEPGRDAKPVTTTMDQLPGPPGVPFLGNILQINIEKLHRIIENWSNQYGLFLKSNSVPFLL